MSLLDDFRSWIRSGVRTDVARTKVRVRLLEKRRHPGTVAKHNRRITEILDEVEQEVTDQMDSAGPGPAA